MKIKTGQVVYCEKIGIYHKFTGDHVHDVRPLTLAESGYQDRIEELEAELKRVKKAKVYCDVLNPRSLKGVAVEER